VHGLVASVSKAPYVAAKHAVVGLTKAVALETAGSGTLQRMPVRYRDSC
jgi:3-hydroxybutyrate dehydrogenase